MITLNQNVKTEQNYVTMKHTDSFFIHIKTEDIYQDIASDAENCLIHLTIMKIIKTPSNRL